MKKAFALVPLLLILVFSTQAFSQSSNASLSGTIADVSGGVIPNVTVTATSTASGVVSTVVSNSAGIYNFPSLLPGTYKVSAQMTGFQTQNFTNVLLGNAAQVRLNFKLEMVGEFRLITAPVDAEMGRGNSQMQVQTKSGSNAYHGSAVWDIQNSALDTNQWAYNRTFPKTSSWRNVHQYTLSLGGPIIKNKTFFMFYGMDRSPVAGIRRIPSC